MTVLLVLATFAIFLTIDYFYSKAKHPVLQVAPAMSKSEGAAMPRLQPSLVGGFSVPDNLRYHPGHTWALSESPNLVRIGMDDFASKLAGKIEHVTLPQRGQWIRQGQKVWSIVRNGVKVDMVSPIEGSVADINEAVVKRSFAGHQGSLRRRLDGDGAIARCQDELPQPAGWSAGPLVDRRVLDAPAAGHAERSGSSGAGWRRGPRRHRQHAARRAVGESHSRVLPDLAQRPRSEPPAPGRS